MRPIKPGSGKLTWLVVAVAIVVTWQVMREGQAPPSDATTEIAEERATPGPDSGAGREVESGHARGSAPRPEPFDFYLLAMTAHPAFCADGNARKAECRADTIVPLSIHGLWPERLAPGEYPRDCRGERLALEPDLERELATLMPGMLDGLHVHEWRTHGRCSGLGDDEYFEHTLTLARRVDAALRGALTSSAGRTVRAADLRARADAAQPGLGATLTFHCRTLRGAPREQRERPFLVEIRQCIDDDGANGAPGTPIACETVRRRDQGCGAGFDIAPLLR